MPSARAEFIVAGAAEAPVKKAQLVTLTIDGGASSDVNPYRPFADISTSHGAAAPAEGWRRRPARFIAKLRFDDLANAKVTATRNLFFSEYFIAFEASTRRRRARSSSPWTGQKETLFDPNNPPSITTTQGAVEQWRIENQTQEIHAFHMHQIHFLVTAINDVRPIPKAQQQLYDVFTVPYWSGHPSESPSRSITVKLDFQRTGRWRLRLPLPHPRSRGRRHDGHHPGAAGRQDREDAEDGEQVGPKKSHRPLYAGDDGVGVGLG